MKSKPFLLHAISPLHAGTGRAADMIDLPIARMKGTGIPIVPGSSIKGVLRDARREKLDANIWLSVFGPNEQDGRFAGALNVTDARLLALPVRSFKGTFAWVTSPLLLLLAMRDLEKTLPVPDIAVRAARLGGDCCLHNGQIFLEDLNLPAETDPQVTAIAACFATLVSPGADVFTKRFVVVDDDTMSFLWDTATQVDARVRINTKTRTADDGALWQEESLPAETLLLGILLADIGRKDKTEMTPDEVLAAALPKTAILQFGGKATAGRGRCRTIPIPGAAAPAV